MQREVVARVTIARIAVRRSPRPSPVPRPIVHVRTLAPIEPHAVARTATGLAAHPEIVRRAGAPRPKPPTVSQAKPVRDVPVGGQGAGAGRRAGAGSLRGGAGGGNGAGDAGAGNGAAPGNEPCGYVEFSDPNGSQYDPQTRGYYVDVQISVHFADGRSDSLTLDYPWYYPDAASDPWSAQNLHDPNFPTTFQSPPPAKRAGEPALVRYVMAHTSSDGYTLLRDCPSVSPR